MTTNRKDDGGGGLTPHDRRLSVEEIAQRLHDSPALDVDSPAIAGFDHWLGELVQRANHPFTTQEAQLVVNALEFNGTPFDTSGASERAVIEKLRVMGKRPEYEAGDYHGEQPGMPDAEDSKS